MRECGNVTTTALCSSSPQLQVVPKTLDTTSANPERGKLFLECLMVNQNQNRAWPPGRRVGGVSCFGSWKQCGDRQ